MSKFLNCLVIFLDVIVYLLWSNALSFYKLKIILDCSNHFGWVPIVLDGSKLFWSGPNHFGQVQIIKISPEKSNLTLTKMLWTRPKWLVLDQNDLDGPNSFWSYRRTRHRSIFSSEHCLKKPRNLASVELHKKQYFWR